MPTPSETQPRDPLGHCRAFEQALAQPELRPLFEGKAGGPDARRAAYWLAVTLGRCRLFGVGLGAADGVLPSNVAIAAAEDFIQHLGHWTADAQQLPKRWDEADTPFEAEEMSFDLLEARMEAWAVAVSIEEAYEDCLAGVDPALPVLRPLVRKCIAAIPIFDEALQQQESFLAVAADTNLLKNWKALLAAPYGDALPWWLDGTLEVAHEQVVEQAIATQPQHLPAAPTEEKTEPVYRRILREQELEQQIGGSRSGSGSGSRSSSRSGSGVVSHPARAWERLELPLTELIWHAGDQAAAGSQKAIIEVEWDRAGYLLILTDGMLRGGRGYSLKAIWSSSEEDVTGEAVTDLGDSRVRLHIDGGDATGPRPGDKLTLRHTWAPTSGEGWDVSITVEFP